MERLTKRIKDAAVCRDCAGTCGTCDGTDCFDVQPMVDRLADYEDAEEQGLLVRLPCKIGTPVWRVNFDKRKRPIQQEAFCAASIDMWKKTVFPSREEAEAALGGNNHEKEVAVCKRIM